MSSLVCTADSYGHVDYKKPLLSNDYRTSSGHYGRYIPPIKTEYYNIKPAIAAEYLRKDVRAKQEYYKTTAKESWIHQYRKPNAAQVANKTGRCTNILCLTNVKEKMFQSPPPPKVYATSEHHAQFTRKENFESHVKLPQTECSLLSTGGDEQPRIMVENPGVSKLLDPYVSTNRLGHYPFTADQIDRGSARHNFNFYTQKEDPLKAIPKEPVYDKMIFKKRLLDRIIPPKVCRVPYVGIQTEYQGRYVCPTTSEFFSAIFDSGVEYPESLSGPNLVQSLCPPGMYCTEYCHLGTGWAPGSVVNLRYDKRVTKHEPCKSEMV